MRYLGLGDWRFIIVILLFLLWHCLFFSCPAVFLTVSQVFPYQFLLCKDSSRCTFLSILLLSIPPFSLSLPPPFPLLSQDRRRKCLFFSILTFPGQAPLLLGQANWSIHGPGGLLCGHADRHTQRAVPRPSASLINTHAHTHTYILLYTHRYYIYLYKSTLS